MAGAESSGCLEGCSSTSCACGGDKDKWGRRLSEDSSRHQLLQKWTSMWNNVSGDASVACAAGTRREETAEPAEEEEEDRPLVFLCSGCRRPLGDSLSWVASQEDANCILLRCQLPRGGWKWGVGRNLGPPSFPGAATERPGRRRGGGYFENARGFYKQENLGR